MSVSKQSAALRIFCREQILTWPNAFTLVRLCCIPLFVFLLFLADKTFEAALLVAVLGSTDWIDGWIARRFDQTTEFGAIFDPVVDRLLLVVVVPCLLVQGSIPLGVAMFAFGRELVVALLALIYTCTSSNRFSVTLEGKTGAFLLMSAFPLFLASTTDFDLAGTFRWLAWFCAAPGLLFGWYSAVAQYGTLTYQASVRE